MKKWKHLFKAAVISAVIAMTAVRYALLQKLVCRMGQLQKCRF